MKKIILFICLACLSGCKEKPRKTDTTEPEKRLSEIEFGRLSIYKDAETGCEYIASNYGGVTPVLKADGTPKCGFK